MRRRLFLLILASCTMCLALHAQRITHQFNNTSMSDALRYLQEQSSQYRIVFIFNDLEDFRVTTSIRNKSVPDALKQIIGFYPITMTIREGHEIYVECAHKTDYRLIGQLVNEKGEPLEYANISLLHPNDSSFVTGGVSNASGIFVIPVELPSVIARISYVGYKTIYKRCKTAKIGTIRMERSITPLQGTLVTTVPKINLQHDGSNYILSNLDGTVMGNAGTALDLLRWTPGIIIGTGDEIRVIGRGTTLVYVNNRPITGTAELRMLNSQDIKRIEVIRDPDAQYPSSADAVIKLYTHGSIKNNLGASLTDIVDIKDKVSNTTTLTLDGKYDKLSGNVSLGYSRYYSRSSNRQYTHLYSGEKNDTTRYGGNGDDYRAFAGLNYALTPNCVIGIQYNGGYSKTGIDLQTSRLYRLKSNNNVYTSYTPETNDMRLRSVSNSFSASYSWQRSDDSQLLVIADYASSNQTNHQETHTLSVYSQSTQENVINYANDYSITTATARYDFATRGWKHKTGLEWGHADNNGEATKDNDTQRSTRDNDWFSAYYMVDKQWNRWRVNVGIRYEFDHTRTIQDVVIRHNKNYHDLLPSVNVKYRVSPDFDLSAGYRRTLVRPTYNQLRSTFYYNVLPHSSLGYSSLTGTDLILFSNSSQAASSSNSLSPNITYINTDDIATGNPKLRATVTDQMTVTALYRHFTAQLSYRNVDNAIQTIHQLLSSGTLCLYPVNIRRFHAWSLDLDYSYSSPKLNIFLLASGTLPHITIPYLGDEIEKRPFAVLHGNVQYNVMQHLMLGCSLLYSTPWTSGYARNNSILGLDLSLRATLCQGRLLLGANYNDVFNRATSTWSETRYMGVQHRTEVNNDSRSVSLLIRWTFNSISNPFKRRSGNDATLQRTQETVN